MKLINTENDHLDRYSILWGKAINYAALDTAFGAALPGYQALAAWDGDYQDEKPGAITLVLLEGSPDPEKAALDILESHDPVFLELTATSFHVGGRSNLKIFAPRPDHAAVVIRVADTPIGVKLDASGRGMLTITGDDPVDVEIRLETPANRCVHNLVLKILE